MNLKCSCDIFTKSSDFSCSAVAVATTVSEECGDISKPFSRVVILHAQSPIVFFSVTSASHPSYRTTFNKVMVRYEVKKQKQKEVVERKTIKVGLIVGGKTPQVNKKKLELAQDAPDRGNKMGLHKK